MRFAEKLSSWIKGRRPEGQERRALLRYHGVWGPGVRLLQNLRFRNKALLLVVGLMLPMGYLIAMDWQRHREALDGSQRAVQGMVVYRLAVAEIEALSDLAMALFVEEGVAVGGPTMPQAVLAEAQAYVALAQAVPSDAADDDVKQALASGQAARQQALRLLNDVRPGHPGEAPPRLDAVNRTVHAMEALRVAALKLLGPGVRADEQMAALINGGLESLPPLQREVRHATAVGMRVYRGEARAGHGMRLMERAAAMQWLLDNTLRDLQPALAHGLVDATQARRALDELTAFTRVVRQLAQASTTAAQPEDLVTALGFGAPRYRELATSAEKAARNLHVDVLRATVSALAAQDARRQQEIRLSLALIVLGVGTMAYLMVCLNKVVGGGLRELCARVDALALGDLSERPEARGTDEVGAAMTALSASVRRMASLFEAVTQGVAAVSHASREVAIGNAGLSGRTGDIRRSIGDVSERAQASMTAMNRCGDEVERIAEHMRDVRAEAQRSRKAMVALQERMRGLQNKSREIGRVVLLVESVAHQTRLLSLNASVEAARAGPAGKGFSVVAQEVRDLARRSESAARKIGEIVQSSVTDIEEGGLLTERVGDSVRLTDERVAEVSAVMADIVRLTHTGRDQSQEVVGITRSVEESAGGNARMVDQLAHASADLRVQGDNLKRSMQHFVFG